MYNEQLTKQQNELIEAWSAKVTGMLKSNATSMFQRGKGSKVIRSMVDAKEKGIKSFVDRKPPEKNDTANEPKLRTTIKSKSFKHTSIEIDGVSFTFARQGIFVMKGVGKGDRTPQDWVNPVLDKMVPELADKIGEINADAIIKHALIKFNDLK